jgi:hypothetical protein
MQDADLQKLLTLQHLSPAELKRYDPELWLRIEAELREKTRSRVVEPISPKDGARRKSKKPGVRTVSRGDPGRRQGAKPAGLDIGPDSARRGAKGRAESAEEALGIDEARPIGEHPDVDSLIRKAHLIQIAAVGKLDRQIVEALGSDAPRPDSLTGAILVKLVRDGKLSKESAAALGAAAAIYELADEDPQLAAAVQAAAGEIEPGVGWTRRLAAMGPDEWLTVVTKSGATLASGTKAADVAAALGRRFASLHPDVALLARLPRVEAGELTKHAGELEVALRKNPALFDREFADLDLSDVEAAQRASVSAAYQRLRSVVRAYPGLRLDEVLADPSRAPADKSATVVRRVSFIEKVQSRAGEISLLHLDFSPGSEDLGLLGLSEIGATPEEQRLVLATFKAYQRAFAISSSVDDALHLLDAGFSSAAAVATQPLAQFQQASQHPMAETWWREARARLSDSALIVGSIVDVVDGMFGEMRMGNVRPDAQDYLRKLDGFESLFGSLAFCSCTHCQSILSPAAYFVDLMRFVEEHITPQFADHPNNALMLKERRPDLWTLELTCDNTNNRIPTLEIANEILENYIAKWKLEELLEKFKATGRDDGLLKKYFGKGKGAASFFSDRDAIGELVYHQTLCDDTNSFRQPFHLPLARVNRYLAKLESSRADVARTLGSVDEVVAEAELRLSPKEWRLVTQQELNTSALSAIYRLTFMQQAGGFAPIDAQALSAAMDVNRDELGCIVTTGFVRAGGAAVEIVAEKKDADSVQNDIEFVHGLDTDALDRMHRFTRLLRHLPWSIAEFDRVLSSLGESALGTSGAQNVALVRAIQRRFDTSVDETAGLVGELPRSPEGASLFDRLFNPQGVSPADRFPKDAERFVHPEFRVDTSIPADRNLPRLLAGVGIDLHGVAVLARHLARHLGAGAGSLKIDAAPEDDRYFSLSAANLTLLWRHARLARLLNVKIDELFQLIEMAAIADGAVKGAADVLAVADWAAWRKGSGYSFDDVAVATGAEPADPSRFVDPPAAATTIVTGALDALSFEETVFSAALGASEQASQDVLEKNPQIVEKTADGRWRLMGGVDLSGAAIIVPPSAVVPDPPAGSRAITAADIQGVLMAYEPSAVLARALGVTFGVDTAKVEALVALRGLSLRTAELAAALRGDESVDRLRDLIASLLPLAVIFTAPEWDAVAIAFVKANPSRFEFNPAQPTLAALRALSVYPRTAKRRAGGDQDASLVDPADIRSAITSFSDTGDFPEATQQLARVFDVSPGLVASLRQRVPLPSVAARALDALGDAIALATVLGLDGGSLTALVEQDYVALDRAADALLTSFGARFRDEAERKAQLDLMGEPLREQKGDALVAWLVRSLEPRQFTRPDDLYQYFLIDAEAGGCSTTSRVVAATSSVQLYIHRVIMNLEQSPDGAPDAVHLRLDEEAATEWDWRRNYRVWEANRKVFLWPENYFEFGPRDDRTPLFKELEDELLQTAIRDQDVLDAYTKYMKGFEELASLTIAGAYQDVKSKIQPNGESDEKSTTDVLHLFGVSSTDPPVFYYRTCENLSAKVGDSNRTAVWTPWLKIDVQITGRHVSPVVFRGRLHVFWIDIKTRPFNEVHEGKSEFTGYRHTMTVKFTTLRSDGTWSPPQPVALPSRGQFGPSAGVIQDDVEKERAALDATDRKHSEPIDDYTLAGPNWDWMWLEPFTLDSTEQVLSARFRDFRFGTNVDMFRRESKGYSEHRPNPLPNLLAAQDMNLSFGVPKIWSANWGANTMANFVISDKRFAEFDREVTLTNYSVGWLTPGLYAEQIATLKEGTESFAIPGSPVDAIFQVGADVVLLQGSVTDDDGYVLRRIGTTLADEVMEKLFVSGVDGLLGVKTQKDLKESGIPLTLLGSRIEDRSNTGKLDFKGPYGVYYREIFFHIPFLIANALNGRGEFASAQRWYHYIFDPTATEVISPKGKSPAERARQLVDRVWRYREFRELDHARMRDILTDAEALIAYREDPFNPHAIARVRLSAYQKSVVMKYVDNLLDWADSLFTQFTMESVNEAMMLYIMASDVLGPRPARLGDCGEGTVSPKTYERIRDEIGPGEEILIEAESWSIGRRIRSTHKAVASQFGLDRTRVNRAKFAASPGVQVGESGHAVTSEDHKETVTPSLGGAAIRSDVNEEPPGFRGMAWKETRTRSWAPARSNSATAGSYGDFVSVSDHRGSHSFTNWAASFGWSVVRQLSPVFCVPGNTDLLRYWDRTEDRLYKIRHCQDITGQKRELALFAPEIDPGLLVRLRAEGLTLEDVLGATSGDVPPYRFLYIVDRAKAFASTLSSFGMALLSSLEKKDGEELNRLRLVHQQNLSRMTAQTRRWEISAAEESLSAIESQKEAAQYRYDYYDGLVNENRSGLEIAESTIQHGVNAYHVSEAALKATAAIAAHIPQVGSPFALTYGGIQLSAFLEQLGGEAGAIAKSLEAAASSLAIEANFARRSEGWEHQRELAKFDVQQLDRQIKAAGFRVEIANRALEVHEMEIDQLNEMLERTDDKFTNLGLYTWLSKQLRQLHRAAYKNALALARLAEQAFRLERDDDASPGLAATYWDPTYSGLLAGERLLLDLQNLERRYLETNYRSLELDQSFALSQIAPDALVNLREMGECHFKVSELFFNLFYPGHFKRRIRTVRVTIPCVTGPYVNVGATLTLEKSWIRTTAEEGAPLSEVPPRRSVSVATSRAQNDAGVFELSFRDDRFMPFEGAGAVSTWMLTLPKTFCPFDYQTISDVVLSISYTAEQDDDLRAAVEKENGEIAQAIRKALADSETPLARVFSLRQEFPSEFARLLHSPVGTDVHIEITDRHFPIFLGLWDIHRDISVQTSKLLLRTKRGAAPGAFAIAVDGTEVSGFLADETLGNLPMKELPTSFNVTMLSTHAIKVNAFGGLAPATPAPEDASAIDGDLLLDVLIYVAYTVSA